VQLIDAETDEHLWADIFDRQLTAANIFAIQTEIATAIADALRATLSSEEERQLATVPTDNLDAYEAYLLGRQRLADRNTDAYAAAHDHFQAAIELDPDFALAYVGLAEAYDLQAFYSGVPREETLEKGRIAAEKAIALNDQLGEAYNALAVIKQDSNDYAGAEEAFKRALDLNPNHALTYHWYGWMLREILGRPEEALELHKRAAELDPRSGPMMTNVSADLQALGRFDEAAEWVALSFERAPDYVENHDEIGTRNRFINGRLDEAIGPYTKVAALDPGNVIYLANLGLAYLDLGGLVEAERWIHRSLGLGPNAFFSNAAMCMLKLRLDEEAEAIEYARRANAANPYADQFQCATGFLRDQALKAGRTLEARSLYGERHPELASREDPRVGRMNYQAAIGLASVALRSDEPGYANLLLDRSLEVLQEVPRLGSFGYGIADVRIYAMRGESEKALAALRRAIDEGWRAFWWYDLEYDLGIEPLHDEPEFRAMVAELASEMTTQLARVREMERNGELATVPDSAVE